jgi:hypothetical protein
MHIPKHTSHTTLLSFHRKRMTKSEYKILMKIKMIEYHHHFYYSHFSTMGYIVFQGCLVKKMQINVIAPSENIWGVMGAKGFTNRGVPLVFSSDCI